MNFDFFCLGLFLEKNGTKAIVLGLDAERQDYSCQQEDISIVLENIQEALQILHLTSCCSA